MAGSCRGHGHEPAHVLISFSALTRRTCVRSRAFQFSSFPSMLRDSNIRSYCTIGSMSVYARRGNFTLAFPPPPSRFWVLSRFYYKVAITRSSMSFASSSRVLARLLSILYVHMYIFLSLSFTYLTLQKHESRSADRQAIESARMMMRGE